MFKELPVFDCNDGIYVVLWEIFERDKLLFLTLLFIRNRGDQLGLEQRAVQIALCVDIRDFVNAFAVVREPDIEARKLADAVDDRVAAGANLNRVSLDLITPSIRISVFCQINISYAVEISLQRGQGHS